jgi:nitrilase
VRDGTRVAAVQAASVFLNVDASVDKACALIADAARRGANVVAFPESFIPGHPIWFRHIIADSLAAREFAVRLFENAIEVPGPHTERLGKAAADAGAYVTVGICERVPGSLGTLYNSVITFDDQGALVGHHRKIMPTGTERLVHAAGNGSSLRVIPTDYGPLGALICGEHTNSFARLALLLQGERIHLAAWPPFTVGANTGPASIDIRSRAHAYEGRLYVVNAAGVIDDATLDCLGVARDDPAVISRGGHSSIVGPDGMFLAGPVDDEETILCADVDFRQITDKKVIQDLTGHYNRFDLFTLRVSPTSGSGLEWHDPSPIGDARKEAL